MAQIETIRHAPFVRGRSDEDIVLLKGIEERNSLRGKFPRVEKCNDWRTVSETCSVKIQYR